MLITRRLVCTIVFAAYFVVSTVAFGQQKAIEVPIVRVNERTLNVFLTSTILAVPNIVPVELAISYNSYDGDRSSFGFKWSHNQDIHVTPYSFGFRIREGDGFDNEYRVSSSLQTSDEAETEWLMVGRDLYSAAVNERDSSPFLDVARRRQFREMETREAWAKRRLPDIALGAGDYYSFARGPSTLTKRQDGTFERKFQNGARERFDNKGRVTELLDRNSNGVGYSYDSKGRLTTIFSLDSPARRITLHYEGDSPLVTRAENSLGRRLSFTYDGQGQLLSIGSADGIGERLAFEYDANGNLISIDRASNTDALHRSYVLLYNNRGEVETVVQSQRKMEFVRTFIGDDTRHSRIEIRTRKDDGTSVLKVREYKLGEYEIESTYDASNKLVTQETKRFSKFTGYPISVIDKEGRGEKYEYEPVSGRLLSVEKVPDGVLTKFEYHPRFADQVCSISELRDGQLQTTATFDFDDRANLKSAVQVDAKTGINVRRIALSYNERGKIAKIRDAVSDVTILFTYADIGKPNSITLVDTGTLTVKYTEDGEIETVVTSMHGNGNERFKHLSDVDMQNAVLAEVRSKLDAVLAFLKPAGISIGL